MYTSINHNLIALTTSNTLNGHYSKLATSVERLSSGLRVNSASDDAAGLAIRELMRADVAAINQGVRNANDAISLIQVADGALAVIDEKLIRMKELAEQAATGTYDSTQRLMIDSEFQAMASEIDRIARATDFNGIKLLDGSRQGEHDGRGLEATGKLKIHFGSANDSAEDYYYLEIGDCTLAGLGLRAPAAGHAVAHTAAKKSSSARAAIEPTLNDSGSLPGPAVMMPDGVLGTMQDIFPDQGTWHSGQDHEKNPTNNFMFLIPQGTKNILINITGGGNELSTNPSNIIDNDIELFTKNGVHLAGTPLDDYVYDNSNFVYIPPWMKNDPTTIDANSAKLGFTSADYDDSHLNTGPPVYNPDVELKYSRYNGMLIGYSGDPDRCDAIPNNGFPETWVDYEILTIDEATEDLIVWVPGYMSADIKVYWDLPAGVLDPPLNLPSGNTPSPQPGLDQGEIISIKTQDEAQQALERINDAIVAKDKVRAHLGAMQNRLENTVANLSIQGVNLQAAESRISDADVATEMVQFVRNQILTQSAVAMLGQANSYPHMLAGLIQG